MKTNTISEEIDCEAVIRLSQTAPHTVPNQHAIRSPLLICTKNIYSNTKSFDQQHSN